MSRINTNVPALVALNHLARAQSGLQTTLERLSRNRAVAQPARLHACDRAASW